MFCFPSLVLATEDNAVVGVDAVNYQLTTKWMVSPKYSAWHVHKVPKYSIVVAV